MSEPPEAGQPARDELERARAIIRGQERSLSELLLEKHEPIAIIGAGLRFPGGNDTLDGFREFLRSGGSGIGPLPRERWDVDAFAPNGATAPGTIHTTAGGFLERIDEFDAQFFNISPKQAAYLDPQQRLLLETAWEALENANLDPTALRHGSGGVYIGASPVDFTLELDSLAYEQLDGALATGFGAYPLSGRLSYFLGWRGPSLTTDTACASSLTALHLAVQGLRRRECAIALCGAVNALHHPRGFVILSHNQMLAPDGRCKTFDDAADGYARAEGCGALVLKRLSDAWRDSDTILALVRGTAIGQDGESAGLTAPNGVAQEAVMRAALADARLEPGDIQYVEAHGTGTPLGDPIEMGSINGVFGGAHGDGDGVVVGSLKSNLGHMEPAAGVGGLLKVVLQMRAGTFFPHLMETPSARIPWDSYRVAVPTECRPWQAPTRRAMVNGFGVAGAIGVAVLEQTPPAPAPTADAGGEGPESHVFTLSAKTRPALALQVEQYRRYLAAHPHLPVADLCYTRNVGRAHFRHRVAGVVASTEDLTALLDRLPADLAGDAPASPTYRRVALLFTGSGSQYPGMGEVLYRRFPAFRERVDECDALFAPHLGRSITEVMFDRSPAAREALRQTVNAHASLFTLEYSLAMLWRSWGIRPAAVIGHSVGEVVAATVAGLFPLPDGVAFLAGRAGLVQSVATPGGMAAVQAAASEVTPLLAEHSGVVLAAVNSPRQCVLSGGAQALAGAVTALRERGFTVTPLNVSTAFHSPLMAEISDGLRAVLAGIRWQEPSLSIISNLTGTVAQPAEIATAEYWIRHLNEPVDFAAGVRSIGDRGQHVFLEVGPSAALVLLARQCLPDGQHRWLSCLHPGDAAGETIDRALAATYAAGLDLSWAAVYAGRPRRKIQLPGYRFDRRRYWLPAQRGRMDPDGAGRTGYRLLGREVVATGTGAREFVTRISAGDPAYLADHTHDGHCFMPAAGYLEMLLELADVRYGELTPIEHVRFHEVLFLTDRPVELRTRTLPGSGGREVEIVSRTGREPGMSERRHVTAVLGEGGGQGRALSRTGRELRRRAAGATAPERTLGAEEVYAAYARAGLDYGPQFSRVRAVAVHGDDLAVSELHGRDIALEEHLPPPILDGATHGLAGLADDGEDYLAVRVARLAAMKKPRSGLLRAVVRRRSPDAGDAGAAFVMDVLLLEDETSEPVMELQGMAFARVARRTRAQAGSGRAARSHGPGTGRIDPATLVARSGPERVAALSGIVTDAVAAVLSIEDVATIDGRATFLELGMDSLVAVKLKDILESVLRVPLASSVAYDHPSVEQLVEHLDRQYAERADQQQAAMAGDAPTTVQAGATGAGREIG